MTKIKIVLLLLILHFKMGCSNDDGNTEQPVNPTIISINHQHQMVEGFGFSTAWGSVPDSSVMDAFFSTTSGAGLSIVRNRIPFRESPSHDDEFMGGGEYDYTVVGTGENQYKVFNLNWNNWDLSTTRKLITRIKNNSDYDVGVYFSTPWTPPNNSVSNWKTDVADAENRPEVGGTLDPAHYADYADVLADYVLGFEENMGAPLFALSLQNEPSYKVGYESCDWTADQLHDFIAVLKTEFDKKGVFDAAPNLAIMAPEANNFTEALLLPTLADENTANVVDIAAGHAYEYGWDASDPLNVNLQPFSNAVQAGKRVWMTEWSVDKFGDADDINANLALAKLIHVGFTELHFNAFVYWWADSLASSNTPYKVLWTIGQWSRFVRPGWKRIGAAQPSVDDVLLSAFVNSDATEIAIVAVNMGTTPQSFALQLDDKKLGPVSEYRTSATEDMLQTDELQGGRNFVNVIAAGESITTWFAAVED